VEGGSAGVEARSITGAEFDAALDKAEQLLGFYDRGRAHIRLSYVLMLASALAVVIPLGVVAASEAFPGLLGITTVGVVGVALLVVMLRRHVRALSATVRRDERAMLEVIDVLRELLPDVAKEEGWGPARYQIAAAWVSRFPIGGRGSR